MIYNMSRQSLSIVEKKIPADDDGKSPKIPPETKHPDEERQSGPQSKIEFSRKVCYIRD